MSPALFAARREKRERAETPPQQARTDRNSIIAPAFAGIDDRRHWQSANLRRLFGVCTRTRQSHLFWLPTADDLADHPRLTLVCKLSGRRGGLLAAVVEELSGVVRD